MLLLYFIIVLYCIVCFLHYKWGSTERLNAIFTGAAVRAAAPTDAPRASRAWYHLLRTFASIHIFRENKRHA